MENQVTSIEQSKRLIDLGLDFLHTELESQTQKKLIYEYRNDVFI
jgi:hypothetical protein